MVVLPLPVGPVTRMRPCGWSIHDSKAPFSSASKPSWAMSCTSVSGSKMRMTTFSPKAVGSVETRSSTSRPSRSVLMRPSCGRRFSEMSMRESIFTRETMGACTPPGSV